MDLRVVVAGDGHRLDGDVEDVELVNAFLAHLSVRNFSSATRRAYAHDLLNFLRFLAGSALSLGRVRAMDLFDYLEWQTRPTCSPGLVVVRIDSRRGAGPATMNRRIAAVRGLFEYAMLSGTCGDNPFLLRGGPVACALSAVGCSGIWDQVANAPADAWFANLGDCHSHWNQLRSRRSSLI